MEVAGKVMGEAKFVAVSATLGINNPLVVELTSKTLLASGVELTSEMLTFCCAFTFEKIEVQPIARMLNKNFASLNVFIYK
jgi:hypothetical protein